MKEILQFQDRICFFLLKSQKNNHSSASDWWEKTKSIFKRMLENFRKLPPLKKILEFQD